MGVERYHCYHGISWISSIRRDYPEIPRVSRVEYPTPWTSAHACSRRSRNWRCNTSPLMPWLSRKRPSYALKGQRTKTENDKKKKPAKEFDDIQGEGMAEIQKGEQTKPCREYQAGTCGNCKIWLQLRTYIISLRAPLWLFTTHSLAANGFGTSVSAFAKRWKLQYVRGELVEEHSPLRSTAYVANTCKNVQIPSTVVIL